MPPQLGGSELGGAPLGDVGAGANVEILPSSIASLEAFGTAELTQAFTITVSGIASLEAFGSLVLTQDQAIVVTGIASLEAFGSLTLIQDQTITVSGIASLEAFGTQVLTQGLTIAVSGIDSAEAFGTTLVTPGNVDIVVSGIATGEAFGSSTVTRDNDQILLPSGVVSAEGFGSVTVTPGDVSITVSGIASAEQFGTLIIFAGSITIASEVYLVSRASTRNFSRGSTRNFVRYVTGMGTTLHDYGKKEPGEVLPYKVRFDKYSSFKETPPEVIASIIVAKCYLADDTTEAEIVGMIPYNHVGADYIILWCGLSAGEAEGDYRFKLKVLGTSGAIYEENGQFIVETVQ